MKKVEMKFERENTPKTIPTKNMNTNVLTLNLNIKPEQPNT